MNEPFGRSARDALHARGGQVSIPVLVNEPFGPRRRFGLQSPHGLPVSIPVLVNEPFGLLGVKLTLSSGHYIVSQFLFW